MYRTECRTFGILRVGRATMRHSLQPELLEALKKSLRDLENVKILNPDDSEILLLRRILRQRIAELENRASSGDKMAA